jgi:hypothetical protein
MSDIGSERVKVNKLFSSDAKSLTPEHTAMFKTYYDL